MLAKKLTEGPDGRIWTIEPLRLLGGSVSGKGRASVKYPARFLAAKKPFYLTLSGTATYNN